MLPSRPRGASPWKSPEEAEQAVGDREPVFSLRVRGADEIVDLLAHALHQVINPLVLAVGRPVEELRPMGGMLYFLMPAEGPRVMGDFSAVHRDLDMVGVGEDGRRAAGVIRGNGVAVRLELDERGLAYRGLDRAVGLIRDGRKGQKGLLKKRRRGRPYESPFWIALVLLSSPPVRLGVEVADVGKLVGLDEGPKVPYGPFDPPFFVSLAGVARMDGDAHVRHVVDELGVENDQAFF